MRDNTKPSIADRGSVRTSNPGTSSGTLGGNGFTESKEYRVLTRNGAFLAGEPRVALAQQRFEQCLLCVQPVFGLVPNP